MKKPKNTTVADLTSLPNSPDIPPPRVIHNKVHNAQLALGSPNAPDDSSIVDLIAGADNSIATGLPDALVDVCVVNLLPHSPGISPPCITHDEVYNARLAPDLPNALDDGRAVNLFAGSNNNLTGLPDAPVDGRVVDLLARAKDNDNNKRSPFGVVHAHVGQNVTPHNQSLGLFLYHFLHTMVS